MLGCTELENLSTQFSMIQIMRHVPLASVHAMFACCVCGNHALRKSGPHAGDACLCLPVDVPDRSYMMVAYPGIHQVYEDSLLYKQYYISTNLSKNKDTLLNSLTHACTAPAPRRGLRRHARPRPDGTEDNSAGS